MLHPPAPSAARAAAWNPCDRRRGRAFADSPGTVPQGPLTEFTELKVGGRNCQVGERGPRSCDFPGQQPGDGSQASQLSSRPQMTQEPQPACCVFGRPCPRREPSQLTAKFTAQQPFLTWQVLISPKQLPPFRNHCPLDPAPVQERLERHGHAHWFPHPSRQCPNHLNVLLVVDNVMFKT